jgi:hypothetical protein
MGLLKLLPSSPLGLKGLTPPTIGSANPQSKLHYEYSINNTPPFPGFPLAAPSVKTSIKEDINFSVDFVKIQCGFSFF